MLLFVLIIKGLVKLLQSLVQPIFVSMTRECESVLLKMHRESYTGESSVKG